MTDRKGNPVKVGDRAYVLPERQTRTGGTGYVRAVTASKVRIDDGPKEDRGEDWTWSAWCRTKEFEVIDSPARA